MRILSYEHSQNSRYKEPGKAQSEHLTTTIPDDEATRNRGQIMTLSYDYQDVQGIRHQKELRHFIVGKETPKVLWPGLGFRF